MDEIATETGLAKRRIAEYCMRKGALAVGIVNAAIVAMPDPRLGEKACCFATFAADRAVTLDELCNRLGDHGIAKHKWPERLVVVADMPMTPTRKIIKGRLSLPD